MMRIGQIVMRTSEQDAVWRLDLFSCNPDYSETKRLFFRLSIM